MQMCNKLQISINLFRRHSRSIPAQNGTRMCCGSDTVFPDSKLTNTGNFTRQVT